MTKNSNFKKRKSINNNHYFLGYMNQKYVYFTIGTWFLFMILAIINAGIRNEIYKPVVGNLRAHQISTIIFIVLILLITYLILRFYKIELSDKDALIIGSIWLTLTICFEFLAGHYAFGNSWDKLLADYNILKGRIWSLVLITTFSAPFVSNRFL